MKKNVSFEVVLAQIKKLKKEYPKNYIGLNTYVSSYK
jgi:hypothetical protein